MINEKLIQLLQTNNDVLSIAKKMNSYIQSERKTLQIVDTIYVNYVSTCVKNTFQINDFIVKLNKCLKKIEANAKKHQELNIDDINYFEYFSYNDEEIIYHVIYKKDKNGFISLVFDDETIPVRLLKWNRFKEQVMKYIKDYNPNNIQNHNVGATYKIIIKAPRINLEYNYTRKKYKHTYWDLDYNIKRHTQNNIEQFKKK